MAVCKECKKIFEADNWHPNQKYCSTLCRCRVAQRKYRKLHPERAKASKKRWEEKNPDWYKKFYWNNREKELLRKKEYREEKPEYVRELMKNRGIRYNKNHPDRRKEISSRYRENHPERAKEIGRNYYWRNHDSVRERVNLYRKNHKELFRAADKKYVLANPEKMREKYNRRRDNGYGFIPLMDNVFPDDVFIDYHHINDMFVVPTPKITHQSVRSSPTDIHRKQMNEKLFWLFGIDFERLLSPV